MLAKSDVDISTFIPFFADMGVPVAFLVPTPTGYGKSIMDATIPVRHLLESEQIHDYNKQKQGRENKIVRSAFFVEADRMEKTLVSLYRPNTKMGDPRIWFYNLTGYCSPCNLLALVVANGAIYVINLSNPKIAASIATKGFVYELVRNIADGKNRVAYELLVKLREIHRQGFLPSITTGDPGVGDTLENALGIQRNNSKNPDYKGIELKSSRIIKSGRMKKATRITLFAKTPEFGCSYKELLEKFGKWQRPRQKDEERLQLYETLRASRPNAYDLQLDVDEIKDMLGIVHNPANLKNKKLPHLSDWAFETLRSTLKLKHRETFWVKAESKFENGKEYFRYNQVLHTRTPNIGLLIPLISKDIITVDLAIHKKKNGQVRDHGMLFKIFMKDLNLLTGVPTEYDLSGD